MKDLEEGGGDGKLYFSLLFGDPTELLAPWQEFEFLKKVQILLVNSAQDFHPPTNNTMKCQST